MLPIIGNKTGAIAVPRQARARSTDLRRQRRESEQIFQRRVE